METEVTPGSHGRPGGRRRLPLDAPVMVIMMMVMVSHGGHVVPVVGWRRGWGGDQSCGHAMCEICVNGVIIE